MHAIKTGPVAIYARFSSELQNERSIEDQVRRCREFITQQGGSAPRVGSRHKCFGWGASTIRAILHNERYEGVWRFKERQWVKVLGTNRRQPQARNAADVMTMECPDLRIIDASDWTEVQARLAAIKGRCRACLRGQAVVRAGDVPGHDRGARCVRGGVDCGGDRQLRGHAGAWRASGGCHGPAPRPASTIGSPNSVR